MQAVVIGREMLMHGCRVRHMLCEPERFENTHAARKEGLPIIAEDDNVERDLVERKKRNCQNWLLELRPMPDSPRVPAPVSLSRRKEVV